MYTTIENIENYLGRTLTAAELAYYTDVLSGAITSYLNNITGLNFENPSAVTYSASGQGTSSLVIPLMSTVTQVAHVDGGALDANDYRTYPATAPYHAIINKNGVWEQGIGNYTVTGTIGGGTVTDDLTKVATELAANAFAVRTDGVKSEKVGDWSATYQVSEQGLSAPSLAVLDGYKRLSTRI